MKRYILRKGDKSTNGGMVTQGVDNCTVSGVPVTYIGAEVWCNGCKSVGHIGSRGPHHNATMPEKQQALDGDICICQCHPAPVLRASQDHSSHSFDTGELAAMGYNAHGAPLPVEQTGNYDERVRVLDANSRPIAGMPYHIRTSSGTVCKGLTDASGYCPRVYTNDQKALDIAVGLKALERWKE
ncbi:PAAR motif-containing protein [Paraburkholderia fungorum]|uniref:PAAR motif-containing protein n=1 Tax=Paraburkholderia fungorum TaxID=134537 RepID=A0A1H1D4Q7_9BURK|nr:PAAR domain-containing protein [Paraburkholderia fungorum]SDQ70806.1 PAAR motif-containing protein [Paraburkholderia fungorum]